MPPFHPLILTRLFTTARPLSQHLVDSTFLSQITAAEKALTNASSPTPNGPTARAQSHANTPLTAQVVHDITLGERNITGNDSLVKGGPGAFAQSALTEALKGGASTAAAAGRKTGNGNNNQTNTNAEAAQHTGTFDSATISQVLDAEREITGAAQPVKGGPTAQAQKHASENITSEALSDVTAGEKKITGGERIKGGPTSRVQSELGKSRS